MNIKKPFNFIKPDDPKRDPNEQGNKPTGRPTPPRQAPINNVGAPIQGARPTAQRPNVQSRQTIPLEYIEAALKGQTAEFQRVQATQRPPQPRQAQTPPKPQSIPIRPIRQAPPQTPQQRPIQQTAPQQRPIQQTAPQPKPIQQTAPQPRPIQQTAPQPKPIQQTAPQQRPIQQTAPQQRPIQQTAPQPRPTVQPKPEVKHVTIDELRVLLASGSKRTPRQTRLIPQTNPITVPTRPSLDGISIDELQAEIIAERAKLAPQPVPQPKQIEQIKPVPQPKQVEQIKPTPQPKQVEQVKPVPQPKQVEQIKPVPQPKQVEQIKPVPQPKQVEQIKPVSQPKQVEQIKPAPQPKQTERPKPQFTFIEAKKPEPIKEQVEHPQPQARPIEKPKPKPIETPKPKPKREPKLRPAIAGFASKFKAGAKVGISAIKYAFITAIAAISAFAKNISTKLRSAIVPKAEALKCAVSAKLTSIKAKSAEKPKREPKPIKAEKPKPQPKPKSEPISARLKTAVASLLARIKSDLKPTVRTEKPKQEAKPKEPLSAVIGKKLSAFADRIRYELSEISLPKLPKRTALPKKQTAPKPAANAFVASLDALTATDIAVTAPPKKKRRSVDRILMDCALAVCICVFVVCAYKIGENLLGKYIGDSFYAKIAEDFFDFDTEVTEATTSSFALEASRPSYMLPDYETALKNKGVAEKYEEYGVSRSQLSVIRSKLNALKETNDEIFGVIKVTGTNIAYTLVRHDDNDYYLNHSTDKSYLVVGSIFLDYRNGTVLGDNYNSILYGHNMTSGTMFHEIEYYESNPELFKTSMIYIYTFEGIYVYKPFSFYATDKRNDYIRTSFTSDEEFAEWAKIVKYRSMYESDAEITKDSKILTLSTCINYSYNGEGRYALHAILIDIITD